MWGDIRAELVKQTKRPASWLLLAIALALLLTFAYVVPYASYAGGTVGPPNSNRGLAEMLPAELVGSALGGTPVFVGALALVFGALLAGGEYGWETWKTVLAQGPSRQRVYAAKVATMATGTLVLVLALLAAAAGASAVVAALEDQPMQWPGLVDLVGGVGAGWLVTSTWAGLGVLLAVGLRSVALPIGLGLVWLLAVQNLVTAIAAPLLDWVADLQQWLPGPNAGSLVAALGASAQTPGVESLTGTGQAVAVLLAYLIAFGVGGGLLLYRRDIV